MRKSNQIFFKGINQRFTNERSVPERLAQLENARLFVRDNTGFVSRITGYENLLNEDDYSDIKAQKVVNGDYNTKGFKRGYLLQFQELIDVLENGTQNKKEFVRVNENFSVFIYETIEEIRDGEFIIDDYFNRDFSRKIPVELKESFQKRILPYKKFVDSVVIQDIPIIRSSIKLSFVDSVDTKDSPLQWPE